MPLVDFDLPEGKSWGDAVNLHLDLEGAVLLMASLSHYIDTLDATAKEIMDAPLSMSAIAETVAMHHTRALAVKTSIQIMEQAMPDIVEEAAKADPKVAAMRDKWLREQSKPETEA